MTGNISFTSNVGNSHAVDAMILNSTGTTTLGGTVNAASILTDIGGTTAINGGSVSTSGLQTYNDSVTLAADTSLTATNNDISMAAINSSNATARSLTLSSGTGAINLSGIIGNVNPLNNFTATSTGATNDIAIANDIHTNGNLSLTAGRNVTLSTGNLISNGNVSLTGTAGAVQETSTGTIIGALLTTNSIGGTTLNNTNAVSSFNATNTSSGNVALTNTQALSIAGIIQTVGNLTINNTGAITQSGAINNAGGTATFSSGSGNNITLTNGLNDFTNIAFNSGNTINVSDANALNFATSNISGNLTANTSGDITQNGTLTIPGTASFTAGAHAITLTLGNAFTGAVSLNNNGAHNIAISNSNALIVNTSNVGTGTLQLTGAGVSQIGVITQAANAGAVTVNAGANTIALTQNNALTGAVSLFNSGANNVSLTNSGALSLGTTTVGTGSLQLSGVGISQTGDITQAAGGGNVTINGNLGVINLANTGNNLTGTVSLNNSGANNVTLMNTGALLTLGASTVGSGIMNVTNTGALTTSGLINASGTVNLTTLPDSIERVLTIGANIQTNGGAINLVAANISPSSATTLVINNTLDTSPGSGGTLSISGGTQLNATPIIGAGNISLNGNGLDLSLGSLSFPFPINFSAKHFINITGALQTTSGAINLQGDKDNSGIGGVFVQTGGSISSSGSLFIQGSNLTGQPGADSTAGIEIQAGATVQAAGAITLVENTGNSNININGALSTSGASPINITTAGNGVIKLGTTISSAGGAINFNSPVNITAPTSVDAGNGALTNGDITFTNVVSGAGQTLTLQNNSASNGTVTFNDNISVGNLITFAKSYAVIFDGTNNNFTNAIVFNNTNGLTLGNTPSAIFNFSGGFTNTASTTSMGSQINTTNQAITLGAVTLAGNSAINTGLGAITLGAVTGAHNLNLDSSVGSALGGTINISTLALSGGGTDALNTTGITTSGSQTYSDAVSLGTNVTLTGAGIALNNAVVGNNHNLSLVDTGTSIFGNAVSGISSLSTNAVNINGGNVTTTGAQSYGVVSLGNNSTLTGSGIQFNSTINGNGHSLILADGTSSTLSGAVNGLSSLATGAVNLNGGSVTTTGGQSYGAISLGNDASLTGIGITFGSTLTGNSHNLIVADSGTSIISGLVTGIANITTNAVNINVGSITTTGTQTYNGLVTLSTPTTFTGDTINFNNGISGNQDLNLWGKSFSVAGTLAINNLVVTGSGGSNGFALNMSGTQNWMITGVDAINILGTPGIAGTVGLSNIQNLTGGSGNDTFTLSGGTVAGNINGGAGSNSLIADNTSNTWNLYQTNTGTVNGISGTFSNIQNLIGGNNNNTFILAKGATITGSINGGSLANTNTLDYSANTAAVTISLTSTFAGNTSGGINYRNINKVLGNFTNDIIHVPSTATVTFTDSSQRQGFINDPLFFSGFQITGNSPPPTTSGPNVSGIIQQPVINGDTSSNTTASSTPEWVVTSDYTNQNLSDVINQFTAEYKTTLSKVKINPFCFALH